MLTTNLNLQRLESRMHGIPSTTTKMAPKNGNRNSINGTHGSLSRNSESASQPNRASFCNGSSSKGVRREVQVGNRSLSIQDIVDVTYHRAKVVLCREQSYRDRIENNVLFLRKAVKSGAPIYGTTTGFGASCDQYVSENYAEELQRRLTIFHQCGTGRPLTDDQVIAVMVARLASLANGRSGVRYELLETLTRMINARIAPVVPSEGSVGASGDLTPLAYIASAIAGGENQVSCGGKLLSAKEALAENNITPIRFGPKEALAIMNGTSVMTGIHALVCADVQRLCQAAEAITATVVQVLHGQRDAFDARIHRLKPFPGQAKSAARIHEALEDSRMLGDFRQAAKSHFNGKEQRSQRLPFKVQDVYSLRCAPHIIGVVRDTLDIARNWTEIELNSVTDNPLIFEEDETTLFGGNFYGGYVSHAADTLKIAVSHLADMADKQIALIVDDKFSNGLSANLVWPSDNEMGLNHGFKGMQITASALTAEVLKNATPASIFSRITESCNQDKVSMGTIAARDAVRSVELTARVLAIVALAAVQALELRGVEKASSATRAFLETIREISPRLTSDRPMDKDIEAVAGHLLQKGR